MSCCEGKSSCGSSADESSCNSKIIFKDDNSILTVECCSEATKIKYFICIFRYGDQIRVNIVDCENDTASAPEELNADDSNCVPCESRCFIDGNTCVIVVDCWSDLSDEKLKEFHCSLKCNGKLYEMALGGVSPFTCNCKCRVEGDTCNVRLDCCKAKGEKPGKCICVCDCGKQGVCVSINNCGSEAEGDSSGEYTENNCKCSCFADKGICVAVSKCCEKEEGSCKCSCKLIC